MEPLNSMNDSIYGRVGNGTSERQIAISQFVSRTYGWMFVGLMVTGIISLSVASSEAAIRMILENRILFFGLMIAEVGLVMGLSALIHRISSLLAILGFLTYSVLNGITLSVIFMLYTLSSVGHVFLIAAAMFGGMALFGTVTKKDLAGVGAFFGMGIWGLILVGLANLFILSESLSLGMSAAGVLIFSGLTAYNAQNIRAMAYQYAANGSQAHATEEGRKGAVFGALVLYLNFINLFLSLLRLFGQRRD